MKRFVLSLLLAAFCAASCNDSAKSPGSNKEDNNMTGGPCSYKDEVAIAEVIKIEKRDTDRYDILFVLRSDSYIVARYDTIHYMYEKNGMLSGGELKKMDVKTGDRYKYIISTIISGSCNPTIRQLVMEKVK